MMAMSLTMQKPEPASGNAWCVPPAVLQASLWCNASRAVSRVPVQSVRRVSRAPQRRGSQGASHVMLHACMLGFLGA